jgi:hypothetical protein
MEYVLRRSEPRDRLVAVGLAHDVLRIYAGDIQIDNSFRFGRDLAAKLDAIQPRWVIVEYPLHVGGGTYEILDRRSYELMQESPGWADWKHGNLRVYEKRAGASNIPL